MDVITHAIVGAATGAQFGHPVVGLVAGIYPDICLGLKRKPEPTPLYNLFHSLPWLAITSCLMLAVGFMMPTAPYADWGMISLAWLFAYLSHIALDIPTHGTQWAPPLLYPFSTRRFTIFNQEWEWFNPAWWIGFFYSVMWVLGCFLFHSVLR